jgi:hypothetical protein
LEGGEERGEGRRGRRGKGRGNCGKGRVTGFGKAG